MAENSNALVPDRYLEALSKQDLEAIVALYAKDATVEDPVGSESHKGHASIRAFYQQTVTMQLSAERSGDVRQAGRELAFPFRVVNRSVEPAIVMEAIDVFRFDEEGKIASMRAYWGPENMRPLSKE